MKGMYFTVHLLFCNGSIFFLLCTILNNPILGLIAACFFTLGSFLNLFIFVWQGRKERAWNYIEKEYKRLDRNGKW